MNSNSVRMRIRVCPPSLDDGYLDRLWEMLQRSLHEILNKNNSGLSFEELYRNAYTLVLHKRGEVLYSGVRNVLTNYLIENIRPTVRSSLNDDFLAKLNAVWDDYRVAMVMIRDILMYMDRVYVSDGMLQTYDMGLRIFRQEILHFDVILKKLQETLLQMISRERKGEKVDRSSMKNACAMLIALDPKKRSVYENDFEKIFLQESANFYRNEAEKLLLENNASIYLNSVDARIEEESERTRNSLDKNSEPKIKNVLCVELIQKHLESILNMSSGIVTMLRDEKVNDLAVMYRLFSFVNGGHEALSQAISVYLLEQGRKVINSDTDKNGSLTFVGNLLQLKDCFDRFLTESFNDDRNFKQKICRDFEIFINENAKSPEFISLYIDDKLKTGKLSENEVEASLDKAMVLFRFLSDKDVFERYYKTHLAKRLIANKSVSDDLEKSMISRLKTECGCQFTSKLEGMMKDILTSSDLIEAFKTHPNMPSTNVDFSIKVLTTGYWPFSANQTGANVLQGGDNKMPLLPVNCKDAFESFKSFYLGKHSGRKLNLFLHHGSADVTAWFYGAPNKDASSAASNNNSSTVVSSVPAQTPGSSVKQRFHILTCQTLQMIILCLFNERASWTLDELSTELDISEKELSRCLVPLYSKAQQRILIKQDDGEAEDEKSARFIVNDNFWSPKTKIRIINPSGSGGTSSKKENDAESKASRQKIEEDRVIVIEAAIVRVMKMRKSLVHNELVAQTTSLLSSRFKPNPQMIKRRIENLINREYLSRDGSDKNLYHYVA